MPLSTNLSTFTFRDGFSLKFDQIAGDVKNVALEPLFVIPDQTLTGSSCL